MNFFTVLTVLFVTLKLTGVINWSWFWVISPLLFGVVLVIGGASTARRIRR